MMRNVASAERGIDRQTAIVARKLPRKMRIIDAVITNPKSGFDRNGDPVLFYKPGEFPSANDPELQLADDARLVYKSGELPLTLRVLAPVSRRMGVPFSYTSYASNHAAKLILLIPILAVIRR